MSTRLDRRPPTTAEEPTGFRKALLVIEEKSKGAVYDCRMCGQCILHSTGMSCPMRCPKNLRNGPCGGVLQDGMCEVTPDRPCVWVQAWEGSRKLPVWRDHMEHVMAPVDWRLQGTSSWENLITQRDRHVPPGWAAATDRNTAG
jgi:hypothetical protein